MRRGKEKDKDKDKQAVAALCRQSLTVDINNEGGENNVSEQSGDPHSNNNGDVQTNDSDPTNRQEDARPLSPSIFKSNSWIMRSLFKK